MALSPIYDVTVDLTQTTTGIGVGSTSLTTQQVAATSFMTGPPGQDATGNTLVSSVAGRIGDVVVTKSDVGLGNVDNTSDASKPVSTAQAAAIAAKATDTAVVHNTGAETVAGVKTFSSAPVVPSNSFPESAITNLTTDLAAKQATLVSGTNIKTINGTTLLGSGDLVVSGGGTTYAGAGGVTILVAASNASAKVKAGADYTCTGSNDHTIINTALAALPSAKGTVILSAGSFSVSDTINLATSQVLQGQGIDATTITGTATTFHVIHMGNRQASGTMSNYMGLRDLSVSAAGGASSFDAVWADGMGNGSFIENVKASEGKYNFRLTDLDQCSVTNIKGFNPRTASIYCEIGLENTWGNVAFYSPSMALSDNNSTCMLIDASAAQTSPNKLDRLTVYGALFYASTGLTGTTGLKTTVGATSFGIYGSLFENPMTHVNLIGQTFMSFNNSTFLQNSGVSTNIVKYETNNHATTFTDCRFQQATNAFNGASGFSRLVFLGSNTNQGTITNLFTGSFGAKHGTDSEFTGDGVLAIGIDNQRIDWGFFNKIRIHDGSPTAGKVWTATNTDGDGTWSTPSGSGTTFTNFITKRVAASTASTAEKASADYVCDGTADEVEINAALTAVQTTGGQVELSGGTFTLAATVAITGGASFADNPTVWLHGQGADATILAPASGIHGITLTNTPKPWITGLRINVLGASDGIRCTAPTTGANDRRGFWMGKFEDLKIQGDFSTHSGWAINMESPFRSTFARIQALGVKNGVWLKSHYANFNPGNLIWEDCHMDLAIANGKGYYLQSADTGGQLNLIDFKECDCIDTAGSSTTSIGWHLKGSSTDYFNVKEIRVTSNVEQFNTSVKLEKSSNVFFNANYTDGKASSTTGVIFDVSSDSGNNYLSPGNIYVRATDTVKAINDLNTTALKPNVFHSGFARVESGGTLTMTKSSATVLRDLYRDSDGTGVYPAEWQAQTTALVVKDEGTELFRGTRSINFAGAGVTATNTAGDVLVTIPGGSGSGITRTTLNVSTNTTAGAAANTDYIYFATGTITITLPTVVGNTNQYSIINIGTGVVTVATTSSQTINGDLTQTLYPYESSGFANNNSQWGAF
jgi:hypothetical protein